MGWAYERESFGDGEAHEGYFVPEFADGERGFGVKVDATAERIPVEELEDGTFRYRQAGEVIGWRICCDCYLRANEGPTELWASNQLWTRVASRMQQDPSTFRLYAPDESVVDPTFGEEVEEAGRALWQREHVDERDALGTIAGGVALQRAGADAVDAGVRKARNIGLSWAKIGATIGVSGQAAHQRWGATNNAT